MTAKITLTWDNGSSEHVDQIVYRSAETFTVDNLPPVLARVGRNAREYIDIDIVTGSAYFYAVASENAASEILLSSVISVTAESSDGDPHWDKVVSLLHFDGDILDQTSMGWNGNGTYGYEQGVFGSSISFSSADQYLHTSGGDFNLGNEDFTLEIWVNQLANAGSNAVPSIFSKRDNAANQSFFLVQDGSGSDFRFGFIDSENTQNNINFGYVDTNTLNTWRHIAIVREGARIMCFVQGVKEKEQDVGEKVIKTTTAMFVVGRLNYTLSTHQFIGKLDELRITKGVARYTENFTPQTEPFPNY